MSDTSLVFNLIGRDQGATSLINRTSAGVQAANLRSTASMGVLKLTSASAAAQMIALALAVAQTSGAVIALPSLAIGAAAGIGALRLSVMNLGAALKTSAGSAGGAAFDYAGAEHRVETALRQSLDAQKSLDDARRQAAETIEDLGRSLRGATLDEEGAARSVAKAEAELRKARRGGNRRDILDADLAYRQSLQTLDEAKARTQDLAEQQADASKKGVEGSDAVQTALQRQADAAYDLAQAQKALAKGASGGGGGADPAAQAFAKLAPAAQALVTTIKSIAPAWQGAQRTVQQAVWSGAAGDLRMLSALYLPVATTQLTRFGGAWNIALRESAGFAKTPGALRQTNVMLGNAATAAQTLGRAVQPVLSALLSIGSAGSSVLPMLASDVLNLATRFERWIAAARESGKLAQWVATGLSTLRELGTIAWNVASAIGAVFRAGGAAEGQGILVWLAEATGRMAAFLNSAEGQDKISAVLSSLRDVITEVVSGLSELNTNGADFGETFKASGAIIGFLANNLGTVAAHLPMIAAAYVIYKTAQTGANVAMIAAIPLRVAELVNSWGQVGAITAHTAALNANTAATGVGIPVTAASGTAAGGASVGFWALTAALLANPITWIVLAIIALIAIIVIIATKTDWFQRLWAWAWGGIKAAALFVWDWLRNDLWPGITGIWNAMAADAGHVVDWVVAKFNWWMDLMLGIRSRIAGALSGLWDTFLAMTKGAINTVISLWNRLDFGIHVHVPDWVPGVGGMGFDINDVIPDIPMLAKGGDILSDGLVFAHKNERVSPAADVKSLDRQGGGGQVLEVRFAGNADSAAATAFKQQVRGGLITFTLLPSGQIAVG